MKKAVHEVSLFKEHTTKLIGQRMMKNAVRKSKSTNNTRVASYNNLVVYQKAKLLTLESLKYFSEVDYPRRYAFMVNQVLRSTSSIAANIAEGCGRHYKKNYRQFLSVARGSSFETEHWLEVVLELKIFDNKVIKTFLKLNKKLSKC